MGRKSNKARDKKVKRQEESAKIAESQKKVKAANELVDPMESLKPFKKFDRNGLQLEIECSRYPKLDPDTAQFAFRLTKDNMQTLYEESEWGWSDKQKKEEMSDDSSWYLVANDSEKKPVAIVHFQFDMEEDDEVLYCYEIQLTKAVRRKGLGKFLMQILELIAYKTEMKKVMVTVFVKNAAAKKFFKETLKYTTDETSPEETMVEAMFDEEGYTYEILSKPVALKKAKSNGV